MTAPRGMRNVDQPGQLVDGWGLGAIRSVALWKVPVLMPTFRHPQLTSVLLRRCSQPAGVIHPGSA
jgi:hypothetical protein